MADQKQAGALQTLLGVVALVAIAGLLVFLATQLTAAVAASLVTALITVGGLVWNRRHERAQAIAIELRAQKAPVYKEFMDFWFQMLLNEKVGKQKPTDREMTLFFIKFTKDLITWGSDEVLLLFAELKNAGGADPIRVMFLFAETMLAIRRDLGHDNKNVDASAVLSTFILDWAEFSGANPLPSTTS